MANNITIQNLGELKAIMKVHDNQLGKRITAYGAISSALALISNQHLSEHLEKAKPLGTSRVTTPHCQFSLNMQENPFFSAT